MKVIIILMDEIVRGDWNFELKFHIIPRQTLTTRSRFRNEGAGVKSKLKAKEEYQALYNHYYDQTFVHPQIYVLNIHPKVMVLGGGVFGQ